MQDLSALIKKYAFLLDCLEDKKALKIKFNKQIFVFSIFNLIQNVLPPFLPPLVHKGAISKRLTSQTATPAQRLFAFCYIFPPPLVALLSITQHSFSSNIICATLPSPFIKRSECETQ
jgi:hypothetical protein